MPVRTLEWSPTTHPSTSTFPPARTTLEADMEFLASVPVVLLLTVLIYVVAGRIVDLELRVTERRLLEEGQAAHDATCPGSDSVP